jgi:hypothetical protein
MAPRRKVHALILIFSMRPSFQPPLATICELPDRAVLLGQNFKALAPEFPFLVLIKSNVEVVPAEEVAT